MTNAMEWLRNNSSRNRCFAILFLLELLKFTDTCYVYLHVVNLYELTEDAATFLNMGNFFLSLCALPVSVTYERVMQVRPSTLIALASMVQGGSALLYGIVISAAAISVNTRLIMCIIIGIPIAVTGHMATTCIDNHLVIEMGSTHGVDMGLINSSMTIIAFALKAVFAVFVGNAYVSLSFLSANITIGCACLVVNSVVAIGGYYSLQSYKPIPAPTNKKAGYFSEISSQFKRFRQIPIFKICCVSIVSSLSLPVTYNSLIFLRCGLSELGLSYVTSAAYVMVILGCILNIFKEQLRFRGRYVPVFIFVKAVNLFFAVYLTTAYMTVVFVPWYRGEELPEEEMRLPAWLLLYIVLYILFNVVAEFYALVLKEFFQVNIPKKDRGAVTGMKKLFTCSLLLAKTGVGTLFSEEWLMFELFVLHVVAGVIGLWIMVAFQVCNSKSGEVLETEKLLSQKTDDDEKALSKNNYEEEETTLLSHDLAGS